MGFVPETGVGLSNSNSYVTLAFANTYHQDRFNTHWESAPDGEKQAALIRATDYIDKRFGRKFRGERQGHDQALEWPRTNAFDSDDFLMSGVDQIPRQLQKATCEYALRALTLRPLAPDPALPFVDRATAGQTTTQSTGTGAGEVVASRQKVGPIEVETQHAQTNTVRTSRGSSQVDGGLIPAFPEADLLLEELLKSSLSRDLARA